MQRMSGLFNTLIQSIQQSSIQDGAQMHTAVSLLLVGLTDPKKLIEGLDYSRLFLDEIEDELMADIGESTARDNEMEVVEICSAEQLETMLGAMTKATKKECRLYAQEMGIHYKLAVTKSSAVNMFSFQLTLTSRFFPQSILFGFSLQKCIKHWRTLFEWSRRRWKKRRNLSVFRQLRKVQKNCGRFRNVNQLLGHLYSTKNSAMLS